MIVFAEPLAQAREARRNVIASLIAVKSHLDTPYPDDPRWTPWTRFIEPQLRRLDKTKAALDLIEQRAADMEKALRQIAQRDPHWALYISTALSAREAAQ